MPDHRPTLILAAARRNVRAALHALIAFAFVFIASDAEADKSKVFYAMEISSLRAAGGVNPAVVRRMVDQVVCGATGKPNAAAAWASLVKPTDRVGIKVAASGRSTGGTHPAVVDAIAQGLASAGVPPANILVWDRNLDDLLAAGFSKKNPHYRLEWTDPANGYDKKTIVTAPVLGRLIWGDSQFGQREGTEMVDVLGSGEQLSSTSHWSKILSTRVDKVVNVPSLQDSMFSGVNGAVPNMTLPNLDNWRRFARAPEFGDPYLAELYADPMVRDKVVLSILDGLFLQYAGGPFPNPGFVVEHHSIFASRDPVALDSTARRLIDEYRAPAKLPSLEKSTLWLESAALLGLGNFEEKSIDLVRVGVRTDPMPTPRPTPGN
jgi:uncharacterized protein (DUF362 family)